MSRMHGRFPSWAPSPAHACMLILANTSTPHHLPVYFGHHAFNTTEMQGTLYHISTQAAVSSSSHLDAQLRPLKLLHSLLYSAAAVILDESRPPTNSSNFHHHWHQTSVAWETPVACDGLQLTPPPDRLLSSLAPSINSDLSLLHLTLMLLIALPHSLYSLASASSFSLFQC
jgi:hypothetical protein